MRELSRGSGENVNHRLPVRTMLLAVGLVFASAGLVSAEVVLCKSAWSSYVKVRHDRCLWGEKEIVLPEGLQGEQGPKGDQGPMGDPGPNGQSAADLCESGHLLMSDGNGGVCLTPAELVALGLCGNGEVNDGEQCDNGQDNGPDGTCTNLCRYNCPCDFFSFQFIRWTDHMPEYSRKGDTDLRRCDLFSGPPSVQSPFLATRTTSSPPYEPTCQVNDEQGTVIDRWVLRGDQAVACDIALVDYVNQLNAIIPVSGDPLQCGLFTP